RLCQAARGVADQVQLVASIRTAGAPAWPNTRTVVETVCELYIRAQCGRLLDRYVVLDSAIVERDSGYRAGVQIARRKRRRDCNRPCGRIVRSAGRDRAGVVNITGDRSLSDDLAAGLDVDPTAAGERATGQIDATVVADANFVDARQGRAVFHV